MTEERQYANFIPYDETCVLKTESEFRKNHKLFKNSEVKECDKCNGEGYINVVTPNHNGINYEHRKRCSTCQGKVCLSSSYFVI